MEVTTTAVLNPIRSTPCDSAPTKPDIFVEEQNVSALADGLIDTTDTVANLIGTLTDRPIHPPSLYTDLEGINPSRHDLISILQLLVLPTSQTFLLDIHMLGDEAFSTPGANGQTLRNILESESIPKVFFDVRNDFDALFSHFHIDLAGIEEIQLIELATRKFSKR